MDNPVSIIKEKFLKIDTLLVVIVVAGVGVGIYRFVEDGCKKAVKLKEEKIKPILENVDIYNRQFKIYKSLYQDLKGDFKRLEGKAV